MRGFLQTFIAGVLLGVPAVGLAQSNDLNSYALFGSSELKIGARSRVTDGDLGTNGTARLQLQVETEAACPLAGNVIKAAAGAQLHGDLFFNQLIAPNANVQGAIHSPITLPILSLPPPPTVVPGPTQRIIPRGATVIVNS